MVVLPCHISMLNSPSVLWLKFVLVWALAMMSASTREVEVCSRVIEELFFFASLRERFSLRVIFSAYLRSSLGDSGIVLRSRPAW